MIALGHRPVVRTAVFGAANLGSNPSAPARVFAGQALKRLTCSLKWSPIGPQFLPNAVPRPALVDSVNGFHDRRVCGHGLQVVGSLCGHARLFDGLGLSFFTFG